jgi:ribonuclease R
LRVKGGPTKRLEDSWPGPAHPKRAAGLPDRETLIRYLREHGEAGKADLAREFGLKGADRRALREMLRSLEAEGALGRRGRRGFAEAGALPPVGVADVVERDGDGDLFVRLAKGGKTPPSRASPPTAPRRWPGLRAWATGCWCASSVWTTPTRARLIKKLGQSAHRILGVIRKARREVRIEPVEPALQRRHDPQ